ncbi:hypothetical protein [Candidatus Halobonum tyrrellensis]|uniref:Uncharacterized protein n=1 Tax=Candidatus Halobonum tyrrellensis G22 TaxID=1324957 RepID=V4HBV9_9EURY|nr:hypothetical protein [Candidatus Halobonum tyrrellensis]ESP87533.1 hypothetical protein K933_13711 [Candidatus Halobonum tyrrellensis G22]
MSLPALQSDPAVPFGAAMVLVGAVVLAVCARYVWRASAVVRASDADSLDGVADGTLVRVAGETRRGDADPLVAPFSGVDCVALRYAVEERRLSPVLLPWYVTVHETAGGDGFRVRTAAAAVPVTAPAGSVVLDERTVATVGPDDDPPERVARCERAVTAVPASTVWRDPPRPLAPLARALSLGTRRYTERRASPGDEVTVVGRADGAGVDPVVVSDRPPGATLYRMARTSLAGVAAGLGGVLLGAFLLA